MAGKRFIPERTVDSLLAAELVRYDPYALIWSPSQRDKNPVDHHVHGRSGSVAVFECKAVVPLSPKQDDGGRFWRAEIDTIQLARYLALPYPVTYAVVSQPDAIEAPYKRQCSVDPCSGWCDCCARDERAWGWLARPIKNAPIKLRFQQWFAHWTWVLDAQAMEELVATNRTTLNDDVIVPVTSSEMMSLRARGRNVTRLCHLLNALQGGTETNRSAPSAVLRRFLVPAGEDVVFVGLNDLEPEGRDPDATLPVVCSFSNEIT